MSRYSLLMYYRSARERHPPHKLRNTALGTPQLGLEVGRDRWE